MDTTGNSADSRTASEIGATPATVTPNQVSNQQRPTSPRLREILVRYTHLRDALPSVMAPRWFFQKSPSIHDQIVFLRALAKADSDMKTAAREEYPEIRDVPKYTVSEAYVAWELPPAVDAVATPEA